MSPVKQLQTGHNAVACHIDGLMQEICNSSALALELRLSCINPSIWIANYNVAIIGTLCSWLKLFYKFSWNKNDVLFSDYYLHKQHRLCFHLCSFVCQQHYRRTDFIAIFTIGQAWYKEQLSELWGCSTSPCNVDSDFFSLPSSLGYTVSWLARLFMLLKLDMAEVCTFSVSCHFRKILPLIIYACEVQSAFMHDDL